jgi:hypothetical protein
LLTDSAHRFQAVKSFPQSFVVTLSWLASSRATFTAAHTKVSDSSGQSCCGKRITWRFVHRHLAETLFGMCLTASCTRSFDPSSARLVSTVFVGSSAKMKKVC